MATVQNTGLVLVYGNIGGAPSGQGYYASVQDLLNAFTNGGSINAGTVTATTLTATSLSSGTVTVSTDAGIILSGQTSDAGGSTATMTNAPHAANPIFWAKISVNGTAGTFPIWAV